MNDQGTPKTPTGTFEAEDGHAYAWGGGSLVLVVLLVLLIIWLL